MKTWLINVSSERKNNVSNKKKLLTVTEIEKYLKHQFLLLVLVACIADGDTKMTNTQKIFILQRDAYRQLCLMCRTHAASGAMYM